MTTPLSLRLSVTDRCQLRCIYCMPECGVRKVRHEDVLTFEEMSHFAGTVQRLRGLTKVHLTGGEPLVRAGIVELIELLAGEGVRDLALTTNGQLLESTATELRAAGLHRVNVSLETLSEEKFRRLSRGGELTRTLAGIEAALEAGLKPVKINVVVIRGKNDDEVVDLLRYGLDRHLEVRFLELMPIGPAAQRYEEWFVPAQEIRCKLAGHCDLVPLERLDGASSVRNAVTLDGRTGTVGFISPHTRPFCSDCRRLRLTATGRLLGCLAREEGVEVRELLRTTSTVPDAEWHRVIDVAMGLKRKGRCFRGQRPMIGIGG